MARAGPWCWPREGKKDTRKIPGSKHLRGSGKDSVRGLKDESGNPQLGGHEVGVTLSMVKKQVGAEEARSDGFRVAQEGQF